MFAHSCVQRELQDEMGLYENSVLPGLVHDATSDSGGIAEVMHIRKCISGGLGFRV